MNWAHYIIQVNIYLVVFYGFYKLLLDKETYFTLNRVYLIAAGTLSLAIPFLRFEWFSQQPVAQPVYITVGQFNELVTQVVVAPEKTSLINLSSILVMLYFTGVLLFVLRLVYQLSIVRRLMRNNSKGSAFSFFSKQFVDDDLPGSAIISRHEEIHTRQLHSADVLFFEVLGALTWFNPIIYFYKSTIKNIHEYLADEEAARFQGNKDQYAMLLMSNALGVAPNTLINGFFNKSLLKKRIFMLYKQRSRKVAVLKYGLFVPLFAITLVASSATIRNNEKIKEIASEIPLERPLEAVKDAVQQVIIEPSTKAIKEVVSTPGSEKQKSNPRVSAEAPADWQNFYRYLQRMIRYPALAQENKLVGNTQIKFIINNGEIEGANVAGPSLGDGCDVEAMRVILSYPGFKLIPNGKYALKVAFTLSSDVNQNLVTKNPNLPAVPGYAMLEQVIIRGYLSKAPAAEAGNTGTANGEKVYDFVSLETQPTFPGGMDKFYDFVSKTVKYPKEAQEKNIQGKVFLSFVVETDGTLSNIKIERKLSPELDEEAVRVIKISPKWIPGVQDGHPVRVKYNIPMSFSLAKESTAPKVDVTDLLQGKVAGVRIDGSARIGPGGPTSPLYVIDGVKQKKSDDGKPGVSPLSTIPQDNIASIELLKDATAKALYGDDGAYGVIIITTIDKNKPAIKTDKTAKPAELKKVTVKPAAKPVKKAN